MSHKSRIAWVFGFILALVTLAAVTPASANEAAPPIGAWEGTFPDGSGTLTLVVRPNGDCMYHQTVGRCTWQPSAVGGILTITYYNAGMEAHGYYSIVYRSATELVISDPYFKLAMHRVG
jgi:hypothetical protein